MKKKTLIIWATGLVFAFTAPAQQLKIPVASPLQTIKQNFGLSDITIEYSRPGVKGRIIYGDVVPFGKVWRTGANASTKITFGEDVKLEGNAVIAGTYAIYTVPNKDSWDVMLYKDVTLAGNVANYKTENEVLRVKVKPTALTVKVETFTIDFSDITANSLKLLLLWENTSVALNITVDEDAAIMKNIESALSPDDKRPYFQAASYYYDNDKDLNKALEWVNKAIEQNPKAFFAVHLKAKIQMKLKDYTAAIATAEQSMALAEEAKSDDYIKLNEKLIAEAKGKKK